jgi:hypothetical protein
MVLKIKRLLYDEGFTIAGARRHLREQNGAAFASSDSTVSHAGSAAPNGSPALSGHAHAENTAELLSRKMLLDLRDSLRAFLTLLERR